MHKQDILNALTPEIVAKFRTAIEIGKWDNGEKLTDGQRQTCMQAVMVWEHEYLDPQERTGYIHKPVKDNGEIVGEDCVVEHQANYPHIDPNLQEQAVKFKL